MKKRNNHILINLCEDQYNALMYLSNKDRRKLAEYVYLLVVDEIEKRIPQAVTLHDEILKLKIDD